MSAETLRRAAALMRERAEAATWVDFNGKADWQGDIAALGLADDDHDHVASWSPAVALAVARLLETEATLLDNGMESEPSQDALDLARAYLGEAS